MKKNIYTREDFQRWGRLGMERRISKAGGKKKAEQALKDSIGHARKFRWANRLTTVPPIDMVEVVTKKLTDHIKG
jgi:hypothetical protein